MVRVVNHAATMLDQALRGCADAQHASAALTKHVRGAKNAINTPAFSAAIIEAKQRAKDLAGLARAVETAVAAAVAGE